MGYDRYGHTVKKMLKKIHKGESMQDKPRFSRASDILDLAVFMSSKITGVTINEIAERYGVSRRTAERMRDSLMCIFPTIDEIPADDNQKHWGFINYTIANLVAFSPKEIANIEQLRRRTTNKEMKEELGKTVEKIKALSRKKLVSMESNIELFMQTEGYAVRQMPQYKIKIETVSLIREAMHYSKKVLGIYHEKQRLIEPLGLIYGEKIYLVAREQAKGDGIYNYLLHKFDNLTLTNEVFDKGDFDLQQYTNQSFGVYHGKILDVELLFSKELAQDASKYNFHPTQSGTWNSDGTYTVNFKASGSKEIIWHVFRWGAGCRIVAPQSLKDEYKKHLINNLANFE